MSEFVDRFGFASASYANFRPRYPAALFDWLRARAPRARRVWDCGAGSGQAAVALSERFAQVVGTDPSLLQLGHATGAARLDYVAMTAERCAFFDRAFGLVTVAQALHWFDRPAFYREVERVLEPGGVIAVWSYGLVRIDPTIDAIVDRFHDGTMGPFWSPERHLVESGYAGIEFPFREDAPPTFAMTAEWSLGELTGYLSTWSAVGKYRASTGLDPMPAFVSELAERWGDPSTRRQVRWPLMIRVGAVD